MATLEQRVAKLEAQNRRLKALGLVGVAIIGVGIGLGAAQPKPTRIRADIVEAGTIIAEMIKAETVDSAKILAGDLNLYDESGGTSLKVTNTPDGPTLAFTNEGARPQVRLSVPPGSPASEILAPGAAPADPRLAADLEARRQKLTEAQAVRDQLAQENADKKQLVAMARENLQKAEASNQDPARIAMLKRVLQIREIDLSDNEAALKQASAEADRLAAEAGRR